MADQDIPACRIGGVGLIRLSTGEDVAEVRLYQFLVAPGGGAYLATRAGRLSDALDLAGLTVGFLSCRFSLLHGFDDPTGAELADEAWAALIASYAEAFEAGDNNPLRCSIGIGARRLDPSGSWSSADPAALPFLASGACR